MPKLSRYIIMIIATAAVLFLVWYFSNIVSYILISAVLAIIGKPAVDSLLKIRIRKRRFPRWLAALVTLMSIWLVAILFVSLFIPLIFNKVSDLATVDIASIVESFREPIQSLQSFIQRFFSINDPNFSLMDELTRQLTPLVNVNVINHMISSIVSIIGNTAVALFSITFITFFFLKEDNLFHNMVVSVFPKKYEENITHALSSITKLLTRYFTGIIAESTIIMLLLSGAFFTWGLSVETALFMGLVMGILNVVPYIGPLIGAGICIIVGVITPLPDASIWHMVTIVGGTILCVKALDDFVLQPILYSNRVYAHPLEIFIVILIAGSLAGVLGMLLAIPAYTVIRVFAKEFFYNYHLVQKLTEKI